MSLQSHSETFLPHAFTQSFETQGKTIVKPTERNEGERHRLTRREREESRGKTSENWKRKVNSKSNLGLEMLFNPSAKGCSPVAFKGIILWHHHDLD